MNEKRLKPLAISMIVIALVLTAGSFANATSENNVAIISDVNAQTKADVIEAQTKSLIDQTIREHPFVLPHPTTAEDAEPSDPVEQLNRGDSYVAGSTGVKDYAEAVKWYLKSAQQGNADAEYNLGICFHEGLGTEKDYGAAALWLQKAADQNVADAEYNLGLMYLRGEGEPKDVALGTKWLRKAASQGQPAAQVLLHNLNVSTNLHRRSPLDGALFFAVLFLGGALIKGIKKLLTKRDIKYYGAKANAADSRGTEQ